MGTTLVGAATPKVQEKHLMVYNEVLNVKRALSKLEDLVIDLREGTERPMPDCGVEKAIQPPFESVYNTLPNELCDIAARILASEGSIRAMLLR